MLEQDYHVARLNGVEEFIRKRANRLSGGDPMLAEDLEQEAREATIRRLQEDPDSPFLFTLGQTVQTRRADGAIQGARQHPMDFLTRHITGDWGNLGDFDRQQNQEALEIGLRLFSTYRLSTEQDLWVITEADRSATTLLLPEEY